MKRIATIVLFLFSHLLFSQESTLTSEIIHNLNPSPYCDLYIWQVDLDRDDAGLRIPLKEIHFNEKNTIELKPGEYRVSYYFGDRELHSEFIHVPYNEWLVIDKKVFLNPPRLIDVRFYNKTNERKRRITYIEF